MRATTEFLTKIHSKIEENPKVKDEPDPSKKEAAKKKLLQKHRLHSVGLHNLCDRFGESGEEKLLNFCLKRYQAAQTARKRHKP